MRKGQETRERIIARAAPLFNMHGYGGTGIAAIMEAVDLEKGGIYRHFASKEELALAAFDYAADCVRQRMLAAAAGPAQAADVVLAVIDVFRGYASDPPLAGGCPILNTAIDSDDGNPQLRERAQALLAELQQLLQAALQRGVERHEVRPGVDPERLAAVVIATMEGAVMISRLRDDPQPLHWAADHLRAHIEQHVRLARA
jgi:TetR/AcrR family transcriptional repressor of nem operon